MTQYMRGSTGNKNGKIKSSERKTNVLNHGGPGNQNYWYSRWMHSIDIVIDTAFHSHIGKDPFAL